MDFFGRFSSNQGDGTSTSYTVIYDPTSLYLYLEYRQCHTYFLDLDTVSVTILSTSL